MTSFRVTTRAMPLGRLQVSTGRRGVATASWQTRLSSRDLLRSRTHSHKLRTARMSECRRSWPAYVRPTAVAMRSRTNSSSIDQQGKKPNRATYVVKEGHADLQAVRLDGKFETRYGHRPPEAAALSREPVLAEEESEAAANGLEVIRSVVEENREARIGDSEGIPDADVRMQSMAAGVEEGEEEIAQNTVEHESKEEVDPDTAGKAEEEEIAHAKVTGQAEHEVTVTLSNASHTKDEQVHVPATNGCEAKEKEFVMTADVAGESEEGEMAYKTTGKPEEEEAPGALSTAGKAEEQQVHVPANIGGEIEEDAITPDISGDAAKAKKEAQAAVFYIKQAVEASQDVQEDANGHSLGTEEAAIGNSASTDKQLHASPRINGSSSWIVVEDIAALPATDVAHMKPVAAVEGGTSAGMASSPPLEELDPETLVRIINKVQRKNLQLQKQLTEAEFLYSEANHAAEERLAEIEEERQKLVEAVSDKDKPKKAAEDYEVQPVTGSHEERDDVLAGERENVTSSYCAVQHPGVQCCTDVSVSKDEGTTECVVTVRTSAKHCDDQKVISSSLNMPHMVALAGQAMLTSVSDFCQENNRGLASSMFTQRRTDRHKYLKKVLGRGIVVDVLEKRVSQFGHENITIRLQDPDSADIITAIFKPRVKGDGRGWHRAPVEAVAYKLNLMLGMDRVPPVAYRTGGIDVDFQHYEEGAFIYFSDNCSELQEHDEEEWGLDKDILLSDIRVLDVLLHNSDRHHGHILMGDHWVEGHWVDDKWRGNQRPMLIDHAAGFRKEALVTMRHDNAFQTGAVTCISARTYLRLRFLDAATIASNFSRYLSEREMRELLMRRNAILRYFDQLVETRGYENTVVE